VGYQTNSVEIQMLCDESRLGRQGVIYGALVLGVAIGMNAAR
jgi:hypothetical protein